MNLFNTIAALKESDEIVFGEIFQEYHQKVYYYILSKTNSAYIAEETTQLTFIKLWNYRCSLDVSLPISSQIFRIAKTTCIDLLRKESNRLKLSLAEKDQRNLVNDISENIEKKELHRKLVAIVKQMPPMRRQVFELSRFESKSHKEIAQLLSLSVKTVENHIALAIKQLKHFLFSLFLFLFFF